MEAIAEVMIDLLILAGKKPVRFTLGMISVIGVTLWITVT